MQRQKQSPIQSAPNLQALPGYTVVGCAEGIGRQGMPIEEYAPAAWASGDGCNTVPSALMFAATEASRLAGGRELRITILSAVYSENIEMDRQRALSMAFGRFPHPSAGREIIENIAWVPVSPSIDHNDLAAGIRAEAEYLAGSKPARLDDQMEEEDTAAEPTEWFLFLWPVEAFGFTAATGAQFVAESALENAATIPTPLPKPRARRRV